MIKRDLDNKTRAGASAPALVYGSLACLAVLANLAVLAWLAWLVLNTNH